MEHLANLLENIATVLSEASSGDIEALCNEMSAITHRRNSYVACTHDQSTDTLPHLSIPGVTGKTKNNIAYIHWINLIDDGQLIPDLLEYLANGVLPLLHAYYFDFARDGDVSARDGDVSARDGDVSARDGKDVSVRDGKNIFMKMKGSLVVN